MAIQDVRLRSDVSKMEAVDSSLSMTCVKKEPSNWEDVIIEQALQSPKHDLHVHWASGNSERNISTPHIPNYEGHILMQLLTEIDNTDRTDNITSSSNINKREQPARKAKVKHIIQIESETTTINCKICGDNNSDLSHGGLCHECEIEIVSNLSDDSIDTTRDRLCQLPEKVRPIAKWNLDNNSGSGKSIHMKKKSDFQEKCVVCDKLYDATYLKKHYKVHSVEISKECDHCGKIYHTKQNFMSHVRDSHTRNIYKCENEMCARVFKTRRYFEDHMQAFHTDNPSLFVCDTCGKTFNLYHSFKKHLTTHGDVVYKCDLCDKKYTKRCYLVKHKNAVHFNTKKNNSNKMFTCNYCDKAFRAKQRLEYHMKVHGVNIVTKYLCLFCDKSFSSSLSLQGHKNTHTGSRPYKCTDCNKGFKQSTSLTRHKLIHTGDQPFKCDICDMRFNQQESLKRHRVIHTGERPYACGVCGQRFTQKPYMKLHERTKHGGIVKEVNENKS